MVESYGQALSSDLLVWDLGRHTELPESSSFDRGNAIFLVESDDVSIFRDKLPDLESSLVLKPVNPVVLRALLGEAVMRFEIARIRDAGRNPVAVRACRDGFLRPAIFELQQYDQNRSKLLARRAQDFRAPLMAIEGYCGLLLDRRLGLLNTEQIEVLENIHQSAKRLSRLSTGLLQLSLRPRERVVRSPDEADIEVCIAQAVREVAPLAQSKNIEICMEVESPARQLCFHDLEIEQMLVNLLDSACRFAPKRGKIEIRSSSTFWDRRIPNIVEKFEHADRRRSARQAFNAYRIELHDTGSGISAAELAGIFSYAFDAESYAGSRSGGGDAISTQILRSCNGVAVAQLGRKGATFVLMIPYDTNPRATSETPVRVNRATSQLT